MRSQDRRPRNIIPVVPLDLPDATKRAGKDIDSTKNDSHKVKLGPGSKR